MRWEEGQCRVRGLWFKTTLSVDQEGKNRIWYANVKFSGEFRQRIKYQRCFESHYYLVPDWGQYPLKGVMGKKKERKRSFNEKVVGRVAHLPSEKVFDSRRDDLPASSPHICTRKGSSSEVFLLLWLFLWFPLWWVPNDDTTITWNECNLCKMHWISYRAEKKMVFNFPIAI